MKKLLYLLTLGIFLAVGVGAAPENKLGLEWDANTETNLAGYKVYYNTRGPGAPYDGAGQVEGNSPIDVGNVVEFYFNSIDFRAEDFWFVVTAYNTEGFESGYSNEVTTKGLVPLPPRGCILRIPSN